MPIACRAATCSACPCTSARAAREHLGCLARSGVDHSTLSDSIDVIERCINRGRWDEDNPSDVLGLFATMDSIEDSGRTESPYVEAIENESTYSDLGLSGRLSQVWSRSIKRRKERRKARKERRGKRRSAWWERLKARMRTLKKKGWKAYRKQTKKDVKTGRALRKEHFKASKKEYKESRKLRKIEKYHKRAGVDMDARQLSAEAAAQAAGIDPGAEAAEERAQSERETAEIEQGAQAIQARGSFLWPTDKPIYLRPAAIGGAVLLVVLAGVALTGKKKGKPSEEGK